MKEQIQTILDSTEDEKEIFEQVNDLMKIYKRNQRGRKTYAFPDDISMLSLSQILEVKGMSQNAVYEKMRNDKNKGFGTANENKELTKALINYTGKSRKELLIGFPIKS